MKRILKWIGRIIGGIVVLIVIAVGTVYAISETRLNKTYSTEVDNLVIPTDSASLERGRHLVAAVGKCAGCHGDNLTGSKLMDEPIFARLNGPNITPKSGLSDQDMIRSIRYGVRRDGKSLVLMPSEEFNRFSDRDLASIVAYLRTVPAADSAVPRVREIGPIARALIVFGAVIFPADVARRGANRLPDVPEGATKEYGEYLITTGACQGCHRQNLSGGEEIDGVPTANLTPRALGKWTEADFVKTIRTGVRPDGRILSAVMPWPLMKELTDTELRAMWLYLQSIPPKETGEK